MYFAAVPRDSRPAILGGRFTFRPGPRCNMSQAPQPNRGVTGGGSWNTTIEYWSARSVAPSLYLLAANKCFSPTKDSKTNRSAARDVKPSAPRAAVEEAAEL